MARQGTQPERLRPWGRGPSYSDAVRPGRPSDAYGVTIRLPRDDEAAGMGAKDNLQGRFVGVVVRRADALRPRQPPA